MDSLVNFKQYWTTHLLQVLQMLDISVSHLKRGKGKNRLSWHSDLLHQHVRRDMIRGQMISNGSKKQRN